ERVTKMCYAMVTIYGMNQRVGNVSFNDSQGEWGYQRPYSDHTAEIIDEEVRKLIDECYVRTKALLIEKRVLLDTLAEELLKKEVLFQSDLETLLGKRPFSHKTAYEEYMDSPSLTTETEAADKSNETNND